MKLTLSLVLLAVVLLAFAGCSEDQKKDAAALEQEMLEREGATDTGEAEVEEMVDTTAEAADVAAVPVEEVTEPEIPSGPSGSGWVVQVAACEEMDYAQYLVQKYTQRGYSPYMTTFSHENQLYYRVRIGVFEAKSEAEALKLELVDKYSLDAWVDREG